MSLDQSIRFGRYQLHPAQGLMRGKREIRLTPKSLRVLCVLAARSGQVVSKEELFRAAWPKSAVTDATLISCIQELRKALNDDARSPSYIETVHRRGFRFLPPTSVHAEPVVERNLPPAARAHLGHIVGRNVPMRRMNEALASACEAYRQVVFVSGGPGIGKTALVDLFQSQACAPCEFVFARADCVQHIGPGEAYQPLLEIIARLARLNVRDDLIRALRQVAPLWLAQLPALQARIDADALQRRIAGATAERMLRELTDLIESVAERAPVVLCIEDLHWSDVSTLDWLACFARRTERTRTLIICTYRPGESLLADSLANDLRVRGLCSHIELAPLDESATIAYATQRFPPVEGSEAALERLARAVHQRTEGHPLFIVSVLSDLVSRSELMSRNERWIVSEQLDTRELCLPLDLQRAIERQLSRLDAEQRRILEVACVVGLIVPAALVAAGADVSSGEAERTLTDLARRGAFVREARVTEWPDGTVSATFEFMHALYAEVLREQLSAGRRAALHRAVGLRIEAALGVQAAQSAAELAMHFDFGRDVQRAIRYHEQAAQNNLRRNAHPSAQQHFQRALLLLQQLPECDTRDELEINLCIGSGNVLMQTQGWATADVQAAYTRAHELCRKRGATQRLFPALWNLWVFNAARGDLHEAHRIATQLRKIACDSGDDASLLQAHHANWATLYSIGDLRGSISHADDGIRLYSIDQSDAGNLEYGSHDCGVCARMFSARSLVLFGRTHTAAQRADEAIALANRLAHPFTQAFALAHAAAIHLELGNATLGRDYGKAALTMAKEWRFNLIEGWASCYLGASLVELDEIAEGVSLIRRGIEQARATGSEMFQPHLLGLLAAAQLRNGCFDVGLRIVQEALAMSERTGERFYVAELHRLKGKLHLATSREQESCSLAEQELSKALAVARTQHALLPALRAAAALSRLWASIGMTEKAGQILNLTYAEMTSGLDESELVGSRSLLTVIGKS